MDERYNVLIADSYPHESKQLKEELQKQIEKYKNNEYYDYVKSMINKS